MHSSGIGLHTYENWCMRGFVEKAILISQMITACDADQYQHYDAGYTSIQWRQAGIVGQLPLQNGVFQSTASYWNSLCMGEL
jgi:hypothetical protein